MTETIYIEKQSFDPDACLPHLLMLVGSQPFAIPAHQVREITSTACLTPIPGCPDAILGVMQLHGQLLPVIDLHKRFGLESIGNHTRTCYVILTTESPGQRFEFAVMIDRVMEVRGVQPVSRKPALPRKPEEARKPEEVLKPDEAREPNVVRESDEDHVWFRDAQRIHESVPIVLDAFSLAQQLVDEIHLIRRNRDSKQSIRRFGSAIADNATQNSIRYLR